MSEPFLGMIMMVSNQELRPGQNYEHIPNKAGFRDCLSSVFVLLFLLLLRTETIDRIIFLPLWTLH